MALVPASDVPAEDLSSGALAARVRATRNAALAAERDLLVLATVWADAHPALDRHRQPVPIPEMPQDALAAHFAGIDPDDDLDTPAWAGLPPVAWDAPAGFAAAVGVSTQTGRAMLRDALVLRHRTPRVWSRVRDGVMPAWRAREVARQVAGAPDDVASAIDAAVAPVADRIGPITLTRLLDEAMVALHPELVAQATQERLHQRGVRLTSDPGDHSGLAHLEIHTDLADLADLHHTLTRLAHRLTDLDPALADESLDVRRAIAAGVLADPARADELLSGTDGAQDGADHDDTDGAPRRRSSYTRPLGTTLVIRLSEAALSGDDPTATVAGGPAAGGVTLAERVAAWCGRDHRTINVIGVIDPMIDRSTDAYRPTETQRRVLALRDHHCRFPWCVRAAELCDADHVIPHAAGGATCLCQLVPLCRHHHRLKTHCAYTVVVIEPGVAHWRTPHGHEFLVDHHGTHPLNDVVPRTTARAGPARHDGCLARAG